MKRTSTVDWPLVPIGQIASVVGGGTPSTKVPSNFDGNVPWLTPKDLSGPHDRYVTRGQRNLTQQGLTNSSAQLVPPGTVLLTTRAPIGYVAIAGSEIATNQGFRSLVMKEGMRPEFIYYWLTANKATLEAHSSGSTFGELAGSALQRICVPMPPLPEQRRIAEILGALDDKIELNRRMNETLEQMARALFKSWFVDFDPVCAKMDGCWRRSEPLPGQSSDLYDLFPDQLVPSELGEIPEGWTVSCFDHLAVISGGSTPSTKNPAYWTDGTHRFATPKDLSSLSVPILLDTERRITDEGLGRISSGLLPAGTVLMSSRAPIGYRAIAQNPVAVNQGFIAMEAKPGVSNLFLLYCIKFSQDEIVSRANGSTFLEISKTNFRPIPVLMPDAAVMARYDATARPLVDRIVVNCKVICELASQRDALLPRLVSGALKLPAVVDLSAEQS